MHGRGRTKGGWCASKARQECTRGKAEIYLLWTQAWHDVLFVHSMATDDVYCLLPKGQRKLFRASPVCYSRAPELPWSSCKSRGHHPSHHTDTDHHHTAALIRILTLTKGRCHKWECLEETPTVQKRGLLRLFYCLLHAAFVTLDKKWVWVW